MQHINRLFAFIVPLLSNFRSISLDCYSKIGDAIIDGLLGAVSAVLKLIFKLLSTILSWIIWAVSRVFDLLPFLPPGLGGLLVGGVVVCFVIGIIKFIRG